MEYFIVNNSEICVEETICVVRVQKPGWAGGGQEKSQNQDFIDEVHGLTACMASRRLLVRIQVPETCPMAQNSDDAVFDRICELNA